jgi:hypothetical protein
MALHFIRLLAGRVHFPMHHWAERGTRLGRARLNPAERSQGRDHEGENKDGRLDANHTV